MNKTELKARCEELGIDTKDLDTNAKLEAAIEAKEAELAKADAEKEAAEKEAAEKEAAEKEAAEKEAAASYEDDRGRKWVFKKSAPKTLNIDGHPMSQKEILETEEIISELVYGKNAFLTLIQE